MKGVFNFNLIFAMIAGAMILFLAIYGVIRLGEIFRFQEETETAKELTILTDPLQSGFAEAKYGEISFPEETQIRNFCTANEFGRNDISTAEQTKGEWVYGTEISIYNKYIFSSEKSGSKFYAFSKAFEFPYKVADLIFISSESFCFINPWEEIEEEIEGLGIKNIHIDNCSIEDIRVCFDSSNCEINVFGNVDEGYVEKSGIRSYFIGNLIYGAILADKGIYECNAERLIYRAGRIADIFGKKADLMNSRGIDTNLKEDLILWQSSLEDSKSEDLIVLNQIAKELNNKNELEKRGGGGIW